MARMIMKDLGFDAGAMQKNWDIWKKQSREWGRFDRIEMTEAQAIALAERTMDSPYFSSDTLLRPSIPEFTALLREDGREENTYVCFRRPLLRQGDFLPPLDERLTRTIIPATDAYIYINNEGRLCNMVVTIAKTILDFEGHRMTSSAEFVTYRHDDPVTDYAISNDPEYFHEFVRSMKCLYLGVQMLSLERPEILISETVREEYHGTVKKKGRYKAVRKTRFVKVIHIPKEADLGTGGGHHNMTCPCWGVAGHWRTYKSGKQVWIKPYRKGKKRHDPAAYKPKEYEFPKEDN